MFAAAEVAAAGLALVPDARTHLAAYLLLFALGSFIALYGRAETAALIRRVLAGETLAA